MSRRGRPGDWLKAVLVFLGARLLPERKPDAERPGQDIAPTIERELSSTRRAELVVVAALILTTLGAAGFMVFFVALPDTQLLGLCLGLAFVFLGVALALAGKRVVPQETAVEEREDFGDRAVAQEVEDLVKDGVEGVSRRGLIVGAGCLAGATLGAAAILPASSLGPRVDGRIAATPWRAGRRVVDSDGRPLRVDDIEIGSFRIAFPEGASRDELGASINVVRLAPEEIEVSDERRRGVPEGAIAFSRICTHAGCAVSMYRYPKYEPTQPGPALVCPCHFSTFDVRRGGAVTFGPAGRPLPQLPLALNADRELIAGGDFFDKIGPSYSGVRREEKRS